MNNFLFLFFSLCIIVSSVSAQEESSYFTFKSSGDKFSLGDFSSEETEDITISPPVIDNDNELTNIIVKNSVYTIVPGQEYSVNGIFSQLDIQENNLTELDITNLKGLELLLCNNNNLKSLNLSELAGLEFVVCNDNSLTLLNLSGLTDLELVACNNNKITSLNLSGLTNLEDVICNNNNLTSLDFTGLTKINFILCSENNFSVCGLDSIFLSLPKIKDITEEAIIGICSKKANEAPYNQCRSYIASNKNWMVVDYFDDPLSDEYELISIIDNPEGSYTCQETMISETLISQKKVSVYPMPFVDSFQIDAEELIKEVYIYDMCGKMLVSKSVNENSINLLSPDLKPGMYLLKINTISEVLILRIIKD